MKRIKLCGIVACVSVALSSLSYAATETPEQSTDVKMINLAQQSGCVTCHSIAAGGKGPNGLKPIGPPWQQVAEKYKDKAGAADELTQIVLHGSSPYASHWKGQVSGFAMPPNSVVLDESQAKELVGWILHLAD